MMRLISRGEMQNRSTAGLVIREALALSADIHSCYKKHLPIRWSTTATIDTL